MSDITRLLQAVDDDAPDGANALFDAVYEELRQIARAKMRHEPVGQTLQATALVHEAWLRMGGDQYPRWQNRAHFFGAAAEAMRRILIDRARARQATRRGGDQQRVNVDELPEMADQASNERVLAVDDALTRFALIDPQKAELVKLRFYIGMKGPEIADALGISEPTVKRWWSYSRAWLQHEISAGQANRPANSAPP